MNKVNQVCSQEQLNALEVRITKKLLRIYNEFTQYPTPGDVTTDIFAELAKHRIQVIVPRDRLVNSVSC